jgi:hypothetical protein
MGTALLIGLLLPSTHELEPVPHAAASEPSRDLSCLSSGCQHVDVNTWNTSGHRHYKKMSGRPFETSGWLCFMDPGNLPFGRCVWWGYPIRGYASRPPGIANPFLPKCASIDCVSPVFWKGAS